MEAAREDTTVSQAKGQVKMAELNMRIGPIKGSQAARKCLGPRERGTSGKCEGRQAGGPLLPQGKSPAPLPEVPRAGLDGWELLAGPPLSPAAAVCCHPSHQALGLSQNPVQSRAGPGSPPPVRRPSMGLLLNSHPDPLCTSGREHLPNTLSPYPLGEEGGGASWNPRESRKPT